MNNPVDNFWEIKLDDIKKSLEANNFDVFIAQNAAAAKKIVIKEIIPPTGAKSISWGGFMTFIATGLYEALKNDKKMHVIDTFDKTIHVKRDGNAEESHSWLIFSLREQMQ